jgi:CxxC motif-containing protein (DUF1111 family)
MTARALSRSCLPSMRTSSDIAHSLRHLSCFALIVASSACAEQDAPPHSNALDGVRLVSEDAPDLPLANLDVDWTSRFNQGDGLFEHRYFESQGLGPVYIRSSCGSCHAGDGRGPGAVRKMVMVDKDGVPLTDQSGLTWGNTIRPQTITGVEQGIVAPGEGGSLLITIRQPPAVFGRGYIEAILDSEIERVEAEQAERDDGISGRINWVTYTSHANEDTRFHAHQPGERIIGRFGLKARIATLDDFAADALLGDMGITSDLRPNELPNPEGDTDDRPGVDVTLDTVNRLADYMRVLRIPTRRVQDLTQGQALFEAAQCGACHVPSLHTSEDFALAPLANIEAPVFSDLLLHDMGKGFGDEIHDFDAQSSEWRTAPLLGVRFLRTYLHDGRAKSIEEAIELHGAPDSEASDSVQRFRDLSDEDRDALVAYVSAL